MCIGNGVCNKCALSDLLICNRNFLDEIAAKHGTVHCKSESLSKDEVECWHLLLPYRHGDDSEALVQLIRRDGVGVLVDDGSNLVEDFLFPFFV